MGQVGNVDHARSHYQPDSFLHVIPDSFRDPFLAFELDSGQQACRKDDKAVDSGLRACRKDSKAVDSGLRAYRKDSK